MRKPIGISALVTTRNEEANLERTLAAAREVVDEIVVLDSESTDGTLAIAARHADRIERLAYDHTRIIPWIFQWALDNVTLRNEWVLLLEADQAITPKLAEELAELLSRGTIIEDGFYLPRVQIFRGKRIRFGGYGGKRLLKLFRRGKGRLDPNEEDTRVYVDGPVGSLRHPLEEWNRKEDEILFYLGKHLRYADAFAKEELKRRLGLPFRGAAKPFGTPDERVLWQKRIWYRMPLFVRPFLYFFYRYFLRLGFLDGANGFVFHFLQAFWFRLIVDIRLAELRAATSDPQSG